MTARVLSVSRAAAHAFSKAAVPAIRLLAGIGVEGDAHAGVTVRHRSRVALDPLQPNLRQAHLIHGLDLLDLPECALLRLGAEAAVRVTGLRNPCARIEAFRPGLLPAVLGRV